MVRSVSKSRLMRFPKKVRDNLEKFKDRIEGLGRKALVGGMLLGVSAGLTRAITWDEYINKILVSDTVIGLDVIFEGAETREDSCRLAKEFWNSVQYNLGALYDGLRTYNVDNITNDTIRNLLIYSDITFTAYYLDHYCNKCTSSGN